jgi:hypothetical protein
MPSIIRATTTSGLQVAPDNSGSLELQTNGTTTAITIDTAQRAAFVAGTAAAPAITTAGDTNTGMFFPAADTIAFAEGGVEAMRLDASGNVLVGTTSLASGLSGLAQIQSSGSTGGIIINSATNNIGRLIFTNNNSASNNEGLIRYDGSNTSMQFWTNATERMRIDSSGNVIVGATSSPSPSVVGIMLAKAGDQGYMVSSAGSTATREHWYLYNPNGLVGSVRTSGSGTAYVTTSDYRLKENVAPMTGALDKVAQLKPVTYTWKVDGSDGQGFIAHELQAIVPDCVSGDKDAVDEDGNIKPQGIDTSFLVATLTAAIQEQQTIINDLKARIETLEAK